MCNNCGGGQAENCGSQPLLLHIGEPPTAPAAQAAPAAPAAAPHQNPVELVCEFVSNPERTDYTSARGLGVPLMCRPLQNCFFVQNQQCQVESDNKGADNNQQRSIQCQEIDANGTTIFLCNSGKEQKQEEQQPKQRIELVREEATQCVTPGVCNELLACYPVFSQDQVRCLQGGVVRRAPIQIRTRIHQSHNWSFI